MNHQISLILLIWIIFGCSNTAKLSGTSSDKKKASPKSEQVEVVVENNEETVATSPDNSIEIEQEQSTESIKKEAEEITLTINCSAPETVTKNAGLLTCPANDMVIVSAGDNTGSGLMNQFKCCQLSSVPEKTITKDEKNCQNFTIAGKGFYTDCQEDSFVTGLSITDSSIPSSFTCCQFKIGSDHILSKKDDSEIFTRFAGGNSDCPEGKFVTGLGDRIAPDLRIDEVTCSSGVAKKATNEN